MDVSPSPSPAPIQVPSPVVTPAPAPVPSPIASPMIGSASGIVSNNTPVSPSMFMLQPVGTQPGTAMPVQNNSVGKALASSFNFSNSSLVATALITGVALGFSAYTLAEVNHSYEDNRSLSGNTLTAVRWVQGLTIAASAFTFAGSVTLLALKLKYRV